jgi:hypothetical protein
MASENEYNEAKAEWLAISEQLRALKNGYEVNRFHLLSQYREAQKRMEHEKREWKEALEAAEIEFKKRDLLRKQP